MQYILYATCSLHKKFICIIPIPSPNTEFLKLPEECCTHTFQAYCVIFHTSLGSIQIYCIKQIILDTTLYKPQIIFLSFSIHTHHIKNYVNKIADHNVLSFMYDELFWLKKKLGLTKCYHRVVRIPASYSRGPIFKSQPRDWLSSDVSWFPSVPPGKC
jgi:hypothetical protein